MKQSVSPTPLGYLPILGLLLLTLGLGGGALQEWQVREYLHRQGLLTEATIVERKGLGDFSVKYSFEVTTVGGGTLTISRWEDANLFFYYGFLKNADRVVIEYDPANPSVSRIVGDNTHILTGVLSILGIIVSTYIAIRFTADLLHHYGSLQIVLAELPSIQRAQGMSEMESRSRLLLAAGLLISFGIAGCADSQAASGLPPEFEICEPPCWSNITPGISTEEDAQRILGEQSPGIQCEKLYEDGFIGLTCGDILITVQERGGLVDIIHVPPHAPITLGEIVQRYGEPEAVEFMTGGTPESPSTGLRIFYPKCGMSATFVDKWGDDYTITPDMIAFGLSYRQPQALEVLVEDHMQQSDSWSWSTFWQAWLTSWHGFGDYEQYRPHR